MVRKKCEFFVTEKYSTKNSIFLTAKCSNIFLLFYNVKLKKFAEKKTRLIRLFGGQYYPSSNVIKMT